MKLKAIAATTILAFSGSLSVQAAELNINWKDPQEYRDIRAGTVMNQEQFEQRVIGELTEQFEESAQRLLPSNYVLDIAVDNVDLAGDIEYFIGPFNQDMRVVRDLYFPRLDFSYELRDSEGKVVARGEEDVKDTNFYVMREYVRDEPLFYEKQMIDDWFYDTFFEDISAR